MVVLVTVFDISCILQYSISLGCILLIQMVSVLIIFIFRGTVSQALKEGIYMSMEKYGMETDSSQAIDLLQAEVRNDMISKVDHYMFLPRLVVVECQDLLTGSTLAGARVTRTGCPTHAVIPQLQVGQQVTT